MLKALAPPRRGPLRLGPRLLLGVLLDRVESMAGSVLVAVVDDCLVKVVGGRLHRSLLIAEESRRTTPSPLHEEAGRGARGEARTR